MKKMKRLLSFLLLICMLTSCLVPGVAAATEGSGTLRFDVTLPDGVTAEPVVTVQDANGQEYTPAEGVYALENGDYMYSVRAEGCIAELGFVTVNGATVRKVTLEATPSSDLRLSKLGDDHKNGTNNNPNKTDMMVEGSGYIGWIRPVAWVKYADINLLGGIESYTVNYAIDGSGSCSLGFDLRIGNAGGTFDDAVSVGELHMTKRTGGWGNPGLEASKTVETDVNTAGIHDVYAVFTDGEYNFGYLNLSLKPETGTVKYADFALKVKPYDAEVTVTDLSGNVCQPTEEGGRTFRVAEGFYKYTVSKPGYGTKSDIVIVDRSKTEQVILLSNDATTYKTYEAEDAEITNANIVEDGNCSGGKKVGGFDGTTTLGNVGENFENIANVKFTVPAEDTGIAEVVICYNSSVVSGTQDRIAVKAGSGSAKEVYLNPTGRSTVFVDLTGTDDNVIYVSNVLSPRTSNDGNAWVDLDCIMVNDTLTKGSLEPGELEQPYEQPNNPIITSIFTADPEAHVWPTDPDTLYIYPSHDNYPAQGCNLMDAYHVYSTTNMVDFVDEGEILRSTDLDWKENNIGFMWAPDACYNEEDGYYYFYWPTPLDDNDWGNTWQTGVMRSKYPDHGFEQIEADGFNGYIEGAGGSMMIDVCVRRYDGQAYIYIGGGQHFYQGKLKDDMITLDGELEEIDTTNVLPNYHEGPSVFKRGDFYYLIYPGGKVPESGYGGDRFSYAMSTSPLGPWEYKGYFLNPVGNDTSHGSIVEFHDKWYVFYHTEDMTGDGALRSVAVDEITFNDDGTIQLITKSTTGVEQNGPDYVSPVGQKYAASEATLSGSTYVVKDSSAETGKAVTGMNDQSSSIKFENVDGGENGGRACLKIHYSTTDDLPKVQLFANDVDYKRINLPYTGGRSFFTGVTEFTVKELKPGKTNTIELVGGYGNVNIDYMEVILLDSENEEHSHTLNEVPAEAATCTKEGNIAYWVCSECGKWFSDAEGSNEITDHDSVVIAIDPNNHVGETELRNEKEPTYDEEGYTGDLYCLACGQIKQTGEVIPCLTKPIIPVTPSKPTQKPNTPSVGEKKFPFVDVSSSSWYYDSVREAWENSLIDGVTATEFKPDEQLTVAQAIKLAAALHQMQMDGKVTIKNGSPNWYDSYVSYAVNNGIIEKNYLSYTQAQMNAPVTRGEFVHIFSGALIDAKEINTVADNKIPDVKITDKYGAEIYKFYRAGITVGFDAQGTFHPTSNIKRSEVAAIVLRMYDADARMRITLN